MQHQSIKPAQEKPIERPSGDSLVYESHSGYLPTRHPYHQSPRLLQYNQGSYNYYYPVHRIRYDAFHPHPYLGPHRVPCTSNTSQGGLGQSARSKTYEKTNMKTNLTEMEFPQGMFDNPIVLGMARKGRPPNQYFISDQTNIDFRNEECYETTTSAIDAIMTEMRGASQQAPKSTTGFFRFLKEKKIELLKKYPHLTTQKLNEKIRKAWDRLDEKCKNKYCDLARKDFVDFDLKYKSL